MMVSAIKKEAQINELHKSQVQLVYDEKIADAKTLNEKFLEIFERITPIRNEYNAEFNAGRKVLGM